MKELEAHHNRLLVSPVTEERVGIICRSLGLRGLSAVRNLEVCLKHIAADLEDYARTSHTKSDRKDIITSRTDLLSAFDHLMEALDSDACDLSEALPMECLEAIGLVIAPEVLEDVLGERTPAYLRRDNGVSARRAAGIQYGHILLPEMIRRIRQPLSDWMAEHVEKGGRPPDLRRRFIIRRLARHATEITGQIATASTGSAFMQLCAAVFQAFDLPDEGIEDAIARELKAMGSGASEHDEK
jgi:hypothetical protein